MSPSEATNYFKEEYTKRLDKYTSKVSRYRNELTDEDKVYKLQKIILRLRKEENLNNSFLVEVPDFQGRSQVYYDFFKKDLIQQFKKADLHYWDPKTIVGEFIKEIGNKLKNHHIKRYRGIKESLNELNEDEQHKEKRKDIESKLENEYHDKEFLFSHGEGIQYKALIDWLAEARAFEKIIQNLIKEQEDQILFGEKKESYSKVKPKDKLPFNIDTSKPISPEVLAQKVDYNRDYLRKLIPHNLWKKGAKVIQPEHLPEILEIVKQKKSSGWQT